MQYIKKVSGQNHFYARFFFEKSLKCITEVYQEDFLLSGLNFLYTRFTNALKGTMFENDNNSKKIFLDFQRKLNNLVTSKYTNENLRNFILEASLNLDKSEFQND